MYSRLYIVLERAVVLLLNLLELPSTQSTLCLGLLSLALLFYRRRLLHVIIVFTRFREYLPVEKGVILYLNLLDSCHSKIICSVFC